MAIEKEWSKKIRSRKHLQYIREQGCLICYRPAQAHHLTFVDSDGLRGMRRTGDQFAVPLCDDHHRQLHAHGNEERWWSMQGVDPIGWLSEQFN